jgi:hypothetical protein
MAAQTPETPAAPTSSPAKKRNLVPILIVVGVIVVIIIAAGVYKLTKSSSSSSGATGPPPGKISKNLYTAWQAGDQTAAAKVATPQAVTQIFAIKASEGTGLVFGGCTKVGANPLPKACVFSRPGGELTVTVGRANGKRVVTKVKLGPAATTPTSTG